MTLAPRFLVHLWAALAVARCARRLRRPGHDARAQSAALARWLALAARTESGRRHGLAAELTYAQFRDRLPPRTTDDFQPDVARMLAGEANVLLPGRCPLFVETAGTTGSPRRLLPAPEAVLDHFRTALAEALYLYARRAGHARVFLGRHLHLGASITVAQEGGQYRIGLDGLLTLCLSEWAGANLLAPPGEVAALAEGPDKLAATARAMLGRDVTLLGGTPEKLAALGEVIGSAAPDGAKEAPRFDALWPNLECCVHTGAPLGFHAEAVRAALGPALRLHEIYLAAEGLFAAQDDDHSAALRLITDAGVFFEFLPVDDFAPAALARTGPRCLPLTEVRTGVEYVILVTTPAGLGRCVTGDIVRFTSVQPPRLQLVGRTMHRLNLVGEHLTETDILETVQAVCARNSWSASAVHVAPYEERIAAGVVARAHEWWVELHPHTVRTPMSSVLAPEIDAELAHRNRDYALRREQGLLAPPLVRLVAPGVFEQWARTHQTTAGTAKVPRCRADRLIAGQLKALAPFHQDSIAPFPL